jgi:hypothetical protein
MPITIMVEASETQVRRIRLPPPPRRRDGIANSSQFWNPVSWFYLSVAAGLPWIKRRWQTCAVHRSATPSREQGPGDAAYYNPALARPTGDRVVIKALLSEIAERKSSLNLLFVAVGDQPQGRRDAAIGDTDEPHAGMRLAADACETAALMRRRRTSRPGCRAFWPCRRGSRRCLSPETR